MHVTNFLTSALLLGGALAVPLQGEVPRRGLARSYVRTLQARDRISVLDELLSTTPTVTAPTDESDLHARLSTIWGSKVGLNGTQVAFYSGVKSQIGADIGFPDGIATADLVSPTTAVGSTQNYNPKEPSVEIYPKKNSTDAPYTTPEADLRAAIQIPEFFTYGERPPVILVPGTGSYGGEVFAPNILKVLPGAPFADPVYLNIPGALLDDAQSNAEFVAYAINYISAISGNKNVSLISWSQGGLNVQWAFTFWPSTRSIVSDFVAVSPDFHGTTLAKALCLSAGAGSYNLNPCPPAVIQQEYNSVYVSTLREHGGADAYVPTTTIYSGFFDEIVEPQQGVIASGFLGDERGVGVLNVEVQRACFGRVGAGFYGHAGVLYHPLFVSLVIDALTHDGPGSLDRLDLGEVCKNYIAPGLSVENAIATAGQIVAAGIRLLAYEPRLTEEPTIRGYAL